MFSRVPVEVKLVIVSDISLTCATRLRLLLILVVMLGKDGMMPSLSVHRHLDFDDRSFGSRGSDLRKNDPWRVSPRPLLVCINNIITAPATSGT